MKIKFNEYDSKNRFYGLKRLNFHGYRWDYTYIKERLAYDLYRSMGIITPRAAWAILVVNNELSGLFGMVEQIDGQTSPGTVSKSTTYGKGKIPSSLPGAT
jgi:spore coat protein CotH